MKPLKLFRFAALISSLLWQKGMSKVEESSYRIYATSSKRSTVASLAFSPPATMKLINESQVGQHPSWITFDQDGKGAYVMGDEISHIILDPLQWPDERVISDESSTRKDESSTRKDESSTRKDESSTRKDESSSRKDEFVSGCIVRGFLFIANYLGGSVTVRSVKENDVNANIAPPLRTFNYGREGIGPVTSRQDKAYAHDVSASPDGGWVYVCDLGSDTIHRIRVGQEDCIESVKQEGATSVLEGSGPRHLRFYRNEKDGKQYAYLSSELSCTVTAFAHNSQSGKLTMIGQPLLTVPHGLSLGGTLQEGPQRTTAEIAISPDGRFVYVSNRGDEVEDHITVFKRDSEGSLVYMDWYPTGGLKARHFSISSDGQYLAVAHERSGSIVILKRDETNGALNKIGAVFENLSGTQFAGFYPPQLYV